MYRFPIFLVLLISIISCSPAYQIRKYENNIKGKNILLMQPVNLNEVTGVKEPEEIFNKNLYIGAIEFSGCIITNTNLNNIRQSESRKYLSQNDFSTQASRSLSTAITNSLSKKKYSFREVSTQKEPRVILQNLIEYDVVADREKLPEDGQDNINLPRLVYNPKALDEQARKILLEYNCDYVMIPVIEYYYGHNGGWFNDQEWGCSAGVRMAFQILVYDLHTGRMIMFFRNMEKNIIPCVYRISVPEINRELLPLEKEMTDKIGDAIN